VLSSQAAFAGKDAPLPTTVLINGVVADLKSETLQSPEGAAVALRPQAFATLR
jgi:hypothetical protein